MPFHTWQAHLSFPRSLPCSVLVRVGPPAYPAATPPAPSLSFPGFVESFYHYTAAAAGSSDGSISGLFPFDVSLRNVSGTSYPANFSSFKYSTGVSKASDE